MFELVIVALVDGHDRKHLGFGTEKLLTPWD